MSNVKKKKKQLRKNNLRTINLTFYSFKNKLVHKLEILRRDKLKKPKILNGRNL